MFGGGDEGGGGACDLGGHAGQRSDEARCKPWKHTDKIVRDEDLAIAVRAGSDADGRDADRAGNFGSDVGFDQFEKQAECAGLLSR